MRSSSSVGFLLGFFTLCSERQCNHIVLDQDIRPASCHYRAKEQVSKRNERIREKQNRWGALCHFIFFSIKGTAASDGGTDYFGISLCSRPLELEISRGQANGIFSYKSAYSTISFYATSSFLLLLFRSFCFPLLVVFC